MERFIAIPELRYTVFTFLESPDLLNCAQVCRSWKDDALSVRWRFCCVEMRELMGQLAWVYEVGEDLDGDYSFYNKLEASVEDFDKGDWHAFLKLTAKIHILSMPSQPFHPDSVELVKELVATYGGPLFPNLRRLEILTSAKSSPMVSLGLVTGLTSVLMYGLDAYGDDDGFEEIFSQVAESCPGIRDLRIVTECARSGPIFSVFPKLRSLSYGMGMLFAESWSSLARCTNLAELGIWSVSLEEGAENSLPEGLEFGSLKELRIRKMDDEAALVLLDGTRMPLLQSLLLEKVELTEEEEKDLSDRLKARCPDLKHIDFV
ncbi:hypothetical protein M407DRAFT_142465 [Tulasnella calospora MUT 4182]|uniref:F-box domain-containing protein n=1 Tax=Tulasnella calospora MUT 4182 TaxID=1051891 RepID=A0A0C3KEW4_9AGAM|nr:hypothetical protein M407DRAFT_142465 [Tulasnella calospora MUT 4182]